MFLIVYYSMACISKYFRQYPRLDLSKKELIELPPIPDSTEYLDCSNNPLLFLPPLPNGLKILRVSNTYITELPELPESLLELYIDNTMCLHSLPELPSGLERVWGHYCTLTSLPEFPVFTCVSGLVVDRTHFQKDIKKQLFTQSQRREKAVRQREYEETLKRAEKRCNVYRDELLEVSLHPSRIEKHMKEGMLLSDM